jgi:(p)ppGpp synthase/HD superfamily hydrolase
MFSQDLYKRALDFAARAHGSQQVPGSGFPYVVHLTKVAMEATAACIADPSLDADLVIPCALLHDSMEDAGVTCDQLAAAFGERIASGVQALTKNSTLPKASRMPDALARIRQQPREIWVVKLADRITNLEPAPPDWSPDKRRAYLEEARVIHSALAEASAFLARRLAEKMTSYEASPSAPQVR